MRVTQTMLFRNGVDAMQSKMRDVKQVQEESLTGKKTNRPSDAPSGAFRDIVFSSNLSKVKSLVDTTGLASRRLSTAETHIDVIHNKMLDAQDLVMKLGNSIVDGSPEVLTAASQEALALYQDVFQNINADMDGVPLFSGGTQRLPFDESNPQISNIRKRALGTQYDIDFASQTNLTVSTLDATGAGYPGVPASVRMSYDATNSNYTLNVNGIDQGTVTATNGEIDLGWAKITESSVPTDQDAFYFEVIPKYQGGDKDRDIKISDDRTLQGNITGEQLIEGKEPLGRNTNLFESLSGLRGALLRNDSMEVNKRLGDIREGWAQASDLQSITGIRNVLVDSMNNTLSLEGDHLEETKATNVEVDLYEVLSELTQTQQSLQVMTTVERQLFNTSLLDFIQ
ncbi:flagellin N-terminal helical domain-containing protein [Magnetococcales bacterium HHB-1]